MSGRRNLVIVRAGEQTLHRTWLENGSQRDWDLIVSWYGTIPYEKVGDERIITVSGGKWDGIYKTIEAIPNLLEKYDYIWLPDDDIATDCQTINRIFGLMYQNKLNVGQPSLSWDSYFSHFITLNVPGLHLRFTNMVETMVPCFESKTLKKILPLFEDTMTGFGLDWIWTRLENDNHRKAAIFDCITVHHTRPVGVFLFSRAVNSGRDPILELRNITIRFGLPKPQRLSGHVYSAILYNGITFTKTRFSTHFLVANNTLPYVRLNVPHNNKSWRFKIWRRFLKSYFTKQFSIAKVNIGSSLSYIESNRL